MYLEHHATAVATGARIVHACGFDSIPHDLGALFTVQQLPTDGPVTMRGVVRADGTFSGGTFHSALSAFSRAGRCSAAPPSARKVEPRPEGRRSRRGGRQAAPRHRCSATGWCRCRRSTRSMVARVGAALAAYGPDFTYRHYAGVKTLPVRRRRRGRRRRCSRSPRRCRRCATLLLEPGAAGRGSERGARAQVVVHRRLRRRGRRPDRAHPGVAAATRATPRPRRCSPSRRCAWRSTTTRRPPAR